MAISRSDLAIRIKERLTLTETVERYGLQIRRGFICCPFHTGDRTPSLKLYDNNSWYCFGCGAHGDVIDFVAKMENKSTGEAMRSLAAELGLETRDYSLSDYAAFLRRNRQRKEKAAREEWIRKARLSISAALREARQTIAREDQSKAFFDALQSLSRLEYLSEELELHPEETRETCGGEIETWMKNYPQKNF